MVDTGKQMFIVVTKIHFAKSSSKQWQALPSCPSLEEGDSRGAGHWSVDAVLSQLLSHSDFIGVLGGGVSW